MMAISVKKDKGKKGVLRVFSLLWSVVTTSFSLEQRSGAAGQLSQAGGPGVVGQEHPRWKKSQYKDHRGRECRSLGMSRKPVWLEQGLGKRAERLLGTNLTGLRPW